MKTWLGFVLVMAIGCGDGGEAADASVDAVARDGSVVDAQDAGADDAAAGDAGAPDSGGDDAGEDAAVDECEAVEAPSVHLIGDSTVASGSGWGDFLEDYVDAAVSVTNAARSGRSSKSFYDEGAFDAVRSALVPGDYVLIQFGHNDSKPEAYRRTEPGDAPEFLGTFRDYLETYISEIEAAGATPILMTPVSRMVFSGDEISRTHGDYAHAVRRVASDHDLTLLDLEQRSYETFTALGEEETLRLYAMPDDRTHFPPDKAFRVTEMVRDLLQESSSPLRCVLLE